MPQTGAVTLSKAVHGNPRLRQEVVLLLQHPRGPACCLLLTASRDKDFISQITLLNEVTLG